MTACGCSTAGHCEEASAVESAEASADTDCIGPIAIPRDVSHAVRGLAARSGADELTPFWVCASELAGRMTAGQQQVRARVVCGSREAVAGPLADPADATLTFRTALRRAAWHQGDGQPAEQAPVDVTILVSADGDRVYVERENATLPATSLGLWGRSFVGFLATLATTPDADMITALDAAGANGSFARDRAAS